MDNFRERIDREKLEKQNDLRQKLSTGKCQRCKKDTGTGRVLMNCIGLDCVPGEKFNDDDETLWSVVDL